jgi:hypothetical protein
VTVTGAQDRPGGQRCWPGFGLVGRFAVGVLFFCVLTPIALVLRLAGRDPLRLRLDHRAPSYWIERTRGRETAMKKQF